MSMYTEPFLGALILENSLIAEMASIVRPEHIEDESSQDLYRAILALVEDDKPADVVTLSDDANLSLPYVAEIARTTYSTDRDVVKAWAYAIVQGSKAQRLRNEIRAFSEQSMNLKYDEMVQRIASIALNAEENGGGRERKTTKEVLADRVDAFDQRYNGITSPTGLSTGLKDLDDLIRGYNPGDYVLIAGRPGSGKTVLGMMGAWQCMLAKKPTLVFSLEMPVEELVDRWMVQNSTLTADEYADPQGKDIEHKITSLSMPIAAMTEAQEYLHLYDDVFDVDAIVATAKDMKRRHGELGLVLVDYLQLMTGREDLGRVNEIGAYSRALRLLSLTLGCPVVAISQLSRKCEERTDKRPLLSDLRESGTLEQDGTKILMVYRDEMYNDCPDNQGIAEILVRKHRGGAIGAVPVQATMNRYKFHDLAKQSEH